MSDLIKRLDRLADVLIETRKFSSYCQLVYEVSNELEKLEAENAALKGEVKRYQWLSDRLGEICKANLEAKEMQAAIDAAIAAQSPTDK
jgi:hypothetical protein